MLAIGQILLTVRIRFKETLHLTKLDLENYVGVDDDQASKVGDLHGWRYTAEILGEDFTCDLIYDQRGSLNYEGPVELEELTLLADEERNEED
jgi:hypothetical protein